MLTSTTAAKVRAHRKVTVVAGNVRHESIKTLPIMGGGTAFRADLADMPVHPRLAAEINRQRPSALLQTKTCPAQT